MENKVLIVYASQYGSTQEVAEAAAATLRTYGLVVDVRPVAKAPVLAGYQAVILGAPLYFGTWHKAAHNFLREQRDALAARPLVIFALGPIGQSAQEAQAARTVLDQELAQFPWLSPAAVTVFGGKYDPARLNLVHRLIAALPASPLHGQPASDARDWAAIRSWAGDIAARFNHTPA